MNLYLSGIIELGFYPPRYIPCHHDSIRIADNLGLYDYSDFASRLEYECLFNALERIRDVLELLKPLDIVLK